MSLHHKQLYESADKREYYVGRHPFTRECKKNSLVCLNHGRHGCLPSPQLTITNIPNAKTEQKQQKGESERTSQPELELEKFNIFDELQLELE